MKKLGLILFAAVITLCSTTETFAQKKYKMGYASQETLSYDDTLRLTVDDFSTIKKVTMTASHTLVYVNTASTSLVPGAQLTLKIVGSSTKARDSVNFNSTYFTSPRLTIDTLKSSTISFIYDGSKFIKTASTLIN